MASTTPYKGKAFAAGQKGGSPSPQTSRAIKGVSPDNTDYQFV
jgi:hypothetical protein